MMLWRQRIDPHLERGGPLERQQLCKIRLIVAHRDSVPTKTGFSRQFCKYLSSFIRHP